MRNVSHGARCARILERLSEALEPGLQLSDAFIQRQAVMLGPVGSRFWRVTQWSGVWAAEAFHFQGTHKYLGEGEAVLDRSETFDSFESALSRATSWFAACLADETEAVDRILSFREWETCGLVAARQKVEDDIGALKATLSSLKEERTIRMANIAKLRDSIAHLTYEQKRLSLQPETLRAELEAARKRSDSENVRLVNQIEAFRKRTEELRAARDLALQEKNRTEAAVRRCPGK